MNYCQNCNWYSPRFIYFINNGWLLFEMSSQVYRIDLAIIGHYEDIARDTKYLKLYDT